MSTGDKKKGGLFDDAEGDLLGEIDAWDKTFDALHEPAPEAAADTSPATFAAAPPSDDDRDGDDATQVSSIADFPGLGDPTSGNAVPDETDFSGLDASGAIKIPAAVRATPQVADDAPTGRIAIRGLIDDAPTGRVVLPDADEVTGQRPAAPRGRGDDEDAEPTGRLMIGNIAARRPSTGPAFDEEEDAVLTSALRLPDEDLAAELEPGPGERTDARLTRALLSAQEQQVAEASRAASAFFAETPGAEVRPEADEDFYADVEIASSEAAAMDAGEPSPQQRSTAHVVRRASPMTAAPPIADAPRVVEMTADEQEEPSVPPPPARLETEGPQIEVSEAPEISMTAEEPEPDPGSGPAPVLPPSSGAGVAPAPVSPPAPVAAAVVATARTPAIGRPRTSDEIAAISDNPLPEFDLSLDLDRIRFPEQVGIGSEYDLAQAAAETLLDLERQLERIDDPERAAGLHLEAARLSEIISDLDRARIHFDAALLADPRSLRAHRGLRRVALAAGDVAEAARHLESELGLAGPLERKPLLYHRIDLLRAAGERATARQELEELLAASPVEPRALLIQIELDFVEGRLDEVSRGLERLAAVLADPSLASAVDMAQAQIAERPGGSAQDAQRYYRQIAERDPSSLAAQLGLARGAVVAGAEAHATALTALARGTQVKDGLVAAAWALRAHREAHHAGKAELANDALSIAERVAGEDPWVIDVLAQHALRRGDNTAVATAYRALAERAAVPADRAHAAIRAAAAILAGDGGEREAMRLLDLALTLDPDHEPAAAALWRLRSHEREKNRDERPLIDLTSARIKADPERQRDRIRFAELSAARGDNDLALKALDAGKSSPAIVDAMAAMLASLGRTEKRAALFGEMVGSDNDRIDPEVFALRAALAYEEAALTPVIGRHAVSTTDAMDAWARLLEFAPDFRRALAGTVRLATRFGDQEVLLDALGRAQDRAPTAAAKITIALERARLASHGSGADLGRANELLSTVAEIGGGDPRWGTAALWNAGLRQDWSEAVSILEQWSARAEEASPIASTLLLYRAAQLAGSHAQDPVRASSLFSRVAAAAPGFAIAAELPGAERSHSTPSARAARGDDAFAQLIREGDRLAGEGEVQSAVLQYTRAAELRPHDPLATDPLAWAARAAGAGSPLASLALAAVKRADELGDPIARADAYEDLAAVDADLRGDAASAVVALEAAAEADPSRQTLLRRLEHAYVAEQRWTELGRIRRLQVEALVKTGTGGSDAAALALDRAILAERDELADEDRRAIYRQASTLDPKSRLALFHLENLVRAQGSSAELVTLEEAVAQLFHSDPRTAAAFLTRAGDTLVDLTQLEPAIQLYRRAVDVLPGYLPALQGWRRAAMRGHLWIDFGEATLREGEVTPDPALQVSMLHLAAVALMDRANASERAMVALRRTLTAEPRHEDAFLRLRMLLAEHGDYEDLAGLLEVRLDVEEALPKRVELLRALADLYRNFLGDRDSAKRYFRNILEVLPNDRRAVSAVADLCWEQGAWGEAAEILMVRAKLERDPQVLKEVFLRLGTIFCDHLPDPPNAIKALQRVLAIDGSDHFALSKLIDLGAATGDYRLSLGSAERLLKQEEDPERRVGYLHQIGRIFAQHLGDRPRAERAFTMALDAAPRNPVALAGLVDFYLAGGDHNSIKVHLGRLAGSMRAQLARQPGDAGAYAVIAQAMAARAAAGAKGGQAVARCAAELAQLLGVDSDPVQAVLSATVKPVDAAVLARPEADEILFAATVPSEIRQIFVRVGDKLAKHVANDLKGYGLSKSDRLRPREHHVAAIAQELGERFGLGEVEVYLSPKHPYAAIAEPTSPTTLIVGAQLAKDPKLARFAIASALKLAKSQLALATRPNPQELGALAVAVLRLLGSDVGGADDAMTSGYATKLKKAIPSGLLTELRPYALAIDAVRFRPKAFVEGVIAAGYRAGIAATTSVVTGLSWIGQGKPLDEGVFRDPSFRDLIAFSVSDELAALHAIA